MMIPNMFPNEISIMLSCGCTLNCDYCEVAHNSKSLQYASTLQQNTAKALQDGSFLTNTLKTLEYFNVPVTNITHLDLWGQEPTLNIPYLTEHISDWFQALPQIEYIMFSSNMTTDPHIIINFLKAIDNNIQHNIEVTVQCSYDGQWSCKNKRHVDPQLIKDHIKILLQELNHIVFQYVTVNITTHSVLTFDYIKKYINDDVELTNYILDLEDLNCLTNNTNKNKNISIELSSVVIQAPYEATVEEGVLFTLFLNKIKMLAKKLPLKYCDPAYSLLFNMYTHNNSINTLDDNNWKKRLQSALSSCYDPFVSHILNEESALANMFCGSYTAGFKIMYDGTLLDCLSNLFSTNNDNIDNNNYIKASIQHSEINHGQFLNVTNNPMTEDVQKILSMYTNMPSTFFTIYQSIVNLMITLAECKQISVSYLYDKEKLLRHAYLLTRYDRCTYNSMLETGSRYLKYTGYIKTYCNGVLDLLEEQHNMMKFYGEYKTNGK